MEAVLRKRILIVGVFVFVILAIFIYWFFLTQPHVPLKKTLSYAELPAFLGTVISREGNVITVEGYLVHKAVSKEKEITEQQPLSVKKFLVTEETKIMKKVVAGNTIPQEEPASLNDITAGITIGVDFDLSSAISNGAIPALRIDIVRPQKFSEEEIKKSVVIYHIFKKGLEDKGLSGELEKLAQEFGAEFKRVPVREDSDIPLASFSGEPGELQSVPAIVITSSVKGPMTLQGVQPPYQAYISDIKMYYDILLESAK